MINGLSHDGSSDHICNVCSGEYTDDEGGVEGYFGILPVEFCPTCFSSMCDMVEQYMGDGEEDEEEGYEWEHPASHIAH